MVRKVKEISAEQWMQAFEDKDLKLSNDLDSMVINLDDALRSTLNDLAPEKQATIPLKPKYRYTIDLRSLKHKVRQLEEKWLRYKFESCWIAFKKQWNLYYAKLSQSKKEALRSKIMDCQGDTKMLHKLVNNLTNKTVENLLPPGKSHADLANDFTNFFKN